MPKLDVKVDNFGFYFQFTIQNADGTAYNLTGTTPLIKVWESGSVTAAFTGTCNIVSPATDGICRYLVGSADFDTLGTFLGEIEITKAGYREDTRTFEIEVGESV